MQKRHFYGFEKSYAAACPKYSSSKELRFQKNFYSKKMEISFIFITFAVLMRKYSIFIVLLSIIAGFGLESCSKEYMRHTKMSKKGGITQKDSAAIYFYKRKDFEKASFLIEELLPVVKGTAREEELLYYYAYCKYGLSEFVMASYYFEQFTVKFPNSKKAEECLFMEANCFYQQSDPHYLDQTYTSKAMIQLQSFINAYPESEKVAIASKYLTELRERKAVKAFDQAKLYYKVYEFKSAVQALQVFMEEYSDSRYREEAQFLMFKSAVYLADASVDTKKENRYLDALEYYQKFIDKYPRSNYVKEAESLSKHAQKGLEKIRSAKKVS